MSTEILGFFIILGALVLVLLRRNDWLKLITGETQQSRFGDAEEASAKLRYELQHSADQIIERMGSHIDRLERLIMEADRRSGKLEEQLRKTEEKYQKLLRQQTKRESTRKVSSVDHNRQDVYVKQPIVSQNVGQLPLGMQALQELPDENGHVQPFSDMLEESMALIDSTDVYESHVQNTQPAYTAEPEVVVSPSVADVVGLPLTSEEAAEIEAATALEREPAPMVYPMAPSADLQDIPVVMRSSGEHQNQAVYQDRTSNIIQQEDFPQMTQEPYEEAHEMYVQQTPVQEDGYTEYAAEKPGKDFPADEIMEAQADSMDEPASEQSEYQSTEIPGQVVQTEQPQEITEQDVQAEAISEIPEQNAQEEEPSEAFEQSLTGEETDEAAEQAAKDDGAEERQAVEEALQLRGGGASERARKLLAEGKSVDDVAREVHLGRGAIELIRQMELNRDSVKNS